MRIILVATLSILVQAGLFAQNHRRLEDLVADDPAKRMEAAKSLTEEGTDIGAKDLPILLDAVEKSTISETEFRQEIADVIAQLPYLLMLNAQTMNLRIALKDVPDSITSRVFSVMSKIAEDPEPRIKERAYFALSAFNAGDKTVEKYLVTRWPLESTETARAAIIKALGNTGVQSPEGKQIVLSAIAADSEPLTTTALDVLLFLREQDSLPSAADFLPQVVPVLESSNPLIRNRAIRFIERLGASAKGQVALLKSSAATLQAGETKMLLEQVIQNLEK
jgi:hypothetical protein